MRLPASCLGQRAAFHLFAIMWRRLNKAVTALSMRGGIVPSQPIFEAYCRRERSGLSDSRGWTSFGWRGKAYRMPETVSATPAFSRPLLLIAAAVGIVLAATVALWAHYGTAVFYEMILAGIAACL